MLIIIFLLLFISASISIYFDIKRDMKKKGFTDKRKYQKHLIEEEEKAEKKRIADEKKRIAEEEEEKAEKERIADENKRIAEEKEKAEKKKILQERKRIIKLKMLEEEKAEKKRIAYEKKRIAEEKEKAEKKKILQERKRIIKLKMLEKEKRENNYKILAFKKKNYQSEHRMPTNTQKEKTWIENEGKCSICNKNNSSKRHHPKNRETLSFWWVIAPKLEVILLCESCVIELDIRENKPNYNSNRTITKEVRDSVWRRDEGKCTQCGSNENLELDHIIPYSKGGSNSYRNIQLLCEECNRKKSDSIG